MTEIHDRWCAVRIAGAALLIAAAAPAAGADVIEVPPVVISSFSHSRTFAPSFNETSIADAVVSPGGGGTASIPGFSATINGGDTLVFRVQAPPGHRFRIASAPGASVQSLSMVFSWTAGSDSEFVSNNAVAGFENLSGTQPTIQFALNTVGFTGREARMQQIFQVNGPCTFTAVCCSVTAGVGPGVSRTYTGSGSFDCTATFAGNVPDIAPFLVVEPCPPPTCGTDVCIPSGIPPRGACCTGTMCVLTVSENCAGAGQVFLGIGTVCRPFVRGGTVNACCPADFNGMDGVSVQDIFDFLAEWSAGCP